MKRRGEKKKRPTKLEIMKNVIAMAETYWFTPAEGAAGQRWDWLWALCP